MASVTLTRRIDAPPEAVRAAIADVESFTEAGGFDEVTVEGDRMTLVNVLGFARIELVLDLLDDPDAALAYEQREGIFEAMTTRYAVEPAPDGTEVTATTEFTLGGVVGSVLDDTVIKRQRRREIEKQFDYLESAVED